MLGLAIFVKLLICDRWRDKQTDTHNDSIYCTSIALRCKSG